MHTEITDNIVATPKGWVFYDGECGFCSRGARRWGGLFARHGFSWLPLQTPGLASRLGLSEELLREEMHLQLANGRVAKGVDAWAILFRSVWWLRPMGSLLGLPFIRPLAGRCYRWIARHRYCIGGHCDLRHHPSHHRHTAFFEMP